MSRLGSQRTRSVRMSEKSYFGPELFGFFRELQKNNNREWFTANKQRYESDVQDPFLRFIADFGPRLRKISKHLVADARPVGGSLFRLHRDVRFSKDKTPYKTMAAAHFHYAIKKDVHAPGFYLQLGPAEVFAGGGLWHPDAETLGRVRDAIVATPDRWRSVTSGKAFKATLILWGDTLKRPPRGYDPEHPLIQDLKRKDFVVSARLSEEDACALDFIDRFTEICRKAEPFIGFVTKAIGLPW